MYIAILYIKLEIGALSGKKNIYYLLNDGM